MKTPAARLLAEVIGELLAYGHGYDPSPEVDGYGDRTATLTARDVHGVTFLIRVEELIGAAE